MSDAFVQLHCPLEKTRKALKEGGGQVRSLQRTEFTIFCPLEYCESTLETRG